MLVRKLIYRTAVNALPDRRVLFGHKDSRLPRGQSTARRINCKLVHWALTPAPRRNCSISGMEVL
jgi:hypothetical protein